MTTSPYSPKYPAEYWDARNELERLAEELCNVYENLESQILRDTGRMPTVEQLQTDSLVIHLGNLMQEQAARARAIRLAVAS